MEVLQDDLCFILDLEGFFLNKTFHVRELAYYTWNGEHGRHAFFIPVPYKNLSDKEKRTVNFVRRKINGLTYQPIHAEHFQNVKVLDDLIKDIYVMYKGCSSGERTVVGYKGGHVEKDLLKKLNIPCLNLETLGCPKYDKLRQIIPKNTLLSSCGFHADDNVHHCPVTECHAFWCWYKSFIVNTWRFTKNFLNCQFYV